MISLRLTEEEFEALQSKYAEHGAHSVSELVRDAVQRLIGEPKREFLIGCDGCKSNHPASTIQAWYGENLCPECRKQRGHDA